MPGMVTQTIRGDKEAILALSKIKTGTIMGYRVGLNSALKYLLAETKKVTPRSERGSHGQAPGFLRRSGATQLMGTGAGTKGVISFSAWYAVYVHEILTNWHAPGTYAKFLERTVRNPAKQLIASKIISTSIEIYQIRKIR